MSREREFVDERKHKGQKILIYRVFTPNGEKFLSTWIVKEKEKHVSAETATIEYAFDMMKIHINGSITDETVEED